MAGNTITSQTIIDDNINLVVKVHLASDGSEETATVVVDASTFSPVFTNERLERLDVSTSSAALQASLLWDASTDVPIVALPALMAYSFDWSSIGGLPNNAGTGKTGDILLTTLGLAAGDQLTLVFYIKKVLTQLTPGT